MLGSARVESSLRPTGGAGAVEVDVGFGCCELQFVMLRVELSRLRSQRWGCKLVGEAES